MPHHLHVDTAALVRRVYDEMSMTLPAHKYVNRQRMIAAAKGWSVPMAWDDDTIDDPAAKPHNPKPKPDTKRQQLDEAVVIRVLSGEKLPTTVAERREILRRWLASGRSEKELCTIQGWRGGSYKDAEVAA